MRQILRVWLLIAAPLLYADEPEIAKIVYFTIPKGGSHLLRKAVGLITERPIKMLPSPKHQPLGDFSDSSIRCHHLEPGYDVILEDVSGIFIKAIMIRDPRDVIVSMAAWIQVMANTDAAKEFIKLPLEEQITQLIVNPDLSMNGNYIFIFDTQLTIRCALQWMTNPTVLVCRFEDLVGEKGRGCRIRQIEAISTLSNHLRCSLSQEKIEDIADRLFGDTATFRTGQIGSWRQTFTPLHKELFKARMGKELIELGYEKDNEW